MNGGANRVGPDLSWRVRVTEPRQGAVQSGSRARALLAKLRSNRTLKYASGMTSTRWRAAAHGATGRFCSMVPAAKFAAAPPCHSGVLNKGPGFDWPPSTAPQREQGSVVIARQAGPPKHLWRAATLGERAGGPNAAHPDTQTVSTPYLRLETGDGKLVSENTPKQRTPAPG